MQSLVSIFLVLIGIIFILPNKWFGWFEYVTSIIKIFLFLLIIVLSIALVAGAGPTGKVHTGEFWRDTPVFKNGFIGFAACAMLALAGVSLCRRNCNFFADHHADWRPGLHRHHGW